MERKTTWLLALVLLCGCGRSEVEETAAAMTGGDPDRGVHLLQKYGCGTCHSIPDVRGARGRVGPPLEAIGSRFYLAGRLPNTPDNLIRWIRNPQGIEPGNAMPDVGVTDQEARDIAAYLYTLR